MSWPPAMSAMKRHFALLVLTVASVAASADSLQQRLVAAALSQVGITTRYDGSYRRLSYPGGDVPLEIGVCTDVVIRAYRGLGIDLQVLVHEDMKRAWSAYPRRWALRQPDPNIDHRRVPNLAAFFARHGTALQPGRNASSYVAGDLVTWELPGRLPHIGIVSTRPGPNGPLIVHNIGSGAREEDILFRYPITGHYRFFPASTASQPQPPVGD